MRSPKTITLIKWVQYFWVMSFFVHGLLIPEVREKNSQTLWLVQDIKMLRCNWCPIHTLTRQSGLCEIHTKKATIKLLQNTHLCAAIWLVQATYHSTRKQLFFSGKNYQKIIISGAGAKQRLSWIVVLLRTEEFCYFLE